MSGSTASRLPVLILLAVFASAPSASQLYAQKEPLPDAKTIEQARKQVAAVFEEEYQRATTVEAKIQLVNRMLKVADQTKDDSAGKYALLLVARNVSVIAQSLDRGIAAIEQINRSFEVDYLDLELEFLEEITQQELDDPTILELVALAIKRQQSIIGQGASVGPIIQRYRAAVMSVLVVGKHDREIDRITSHTLHAHLTNQAFIMLKKDPLNGDAHQQAGIHFLSQSIDTDNLSKAISHLVKSSNQAFRKPALLETEGNTELFDDKITLAKAWIDTENRHGGLRALHWLSKAAPQLSTFSGLTLERNKKKLLDLQSAARKLAPSAEKLTAAQPDGPAAFFGTPLVGKKFVFVIDNSNSMRGGRFHTAVNELVKTVEQMEADQYFYVIFFSDTAYPLFWPKPESKMLPATDKNKESLIKWLSTVELCLHTRGSEAMQLALSLRPDAIYVLGDGAFTDKTAQQLTLPHNRRTPIFTLGMQVPEKGKTQLTQIAKANNGTYRLVTVAPGAAQAAARAPIKGNNSRGPVWGIKLPVKR